MHRALEITLIVAAALAPVVAACSSSQQQPASVQKYETSKVVRGDLRVTISATGTVENDALRHE